MPHAKYEKNLLKCQFLYVIIRDLTWPKFCPKDPTHFPFLLLISNEITGTQLINNNISNLCCNPVVLKKKLVKPLKIAGFLMFWLIYESFSILSNIFVKKMSFPVLMHCNGVHL